MRAAAIVPAFQAEPLIGAVVAELCEIWPHPEGVWVVDDGSSDGTAEVARAHGARVLQHGQNRGKGAALRTGFEEAQRCGFELAVTLDADGQHPPREALRLHASCDDDRALVLGIRDLARAQAPTSSRLSNRFSNLVLSGFTGFWLGDTQCGLRRYPIAATLALNGREAGYGYEAEILIRACAAGMPIVEQPIEAIYPPPEQRLSHFRVVRDPARIVSRVVRTVAATRSQQLLAGLRR